MHTAKTYVRPLLSHSYDSRRQRELFAMSKALEVTQWGLTMEEELDVFISRLRSCVALIDFDSRRILVGLWRLSTQSA